MSDKAVGMISIIFFAIVLVVVTLIILFPHRLPDPDNMPATSARMIYIAAQP